MKRDILKKWRFHALIFIAAHTVALAPFPLSAAQVGIKYNRPKSAYPKIAIRDFERFHRDRINTVMIALPWSQWEPSKGSIDNHFISTGLKPVLEYASTHGMTVILANHSVYSGKRGNWTIPAWARKISGYSNARSALTLPEVQEAQADFLKRLIESTYKQSSIIGYNILNEPAIASEYHITRNNKDFQQRWEGTIKIVNDVNEYLKNLHSKHFLVIGNAGSPSRYGALLWSNTGKYNLHNLWGNSLGMIGAQSDNQLREADRWYRDAPKIRTEGYMSFARLPRSGTAAKGLARYKWQPGRGNMATYYDYDNSYTYEGLANTGINNLRAFYVWRVGSTDNKSKHIGLLDARNHFPTPYYFALRDLASGIDSFEAYSQDTMPLTSAATRIFNPQHAVPGISVRWQGTAKIKAERYDVPAHSESTMAAQLDMSPGTYLTRSVISCHWKDNGVISNDSLIFEAKNITTSPITVTLKIDVAKKSISRNINIQTNSWQHYAIRLADFGIKNADIPHIKGISLHNGNKKKISFLLDNILIRPSK